MPKNLWSQSVIAAVLYVLIGHLFPNLSFQVELNAVLNPAAGLALGLALLLGWRILPAIFVGAVALAVTHFYVASKPIALDYLLALAIWMTVQTGLFAVLVREVMGKDNPLHEEKSAVGFLFLVGPLGSLISAAGYALISLAYGKTGGETLWQFALMLWLYDSLVKMVMTPVVLAFQESWRQRRWTVAIPSLLFLLVFTSLYSWNNTASDEKSRLQFSQQMTPLSALLRSRILEFEDVVVFLERYFSSSQDVTKEEFSEFLENASFKSSGLSLVSWVPLVKKEDRAAFEAQSTAYFNHEFKFRPFTSDPTETTPDQQVYLAARYSVPERRNFDNLGIDMASEKRRYEMFMKSWQTRKLVASDPVVLYQDKDLKPVKHSVLLAKAVFRGKPDPEGFVVGVIRFGTLFDQELSRHQLQNVNCLVRDVDTKKVLYERMAADQSSAEVAKHPWQFDETFYVGGQSWNLSFYPAARELVGLSSWLALFVGQLVTLIVEAFLLVMTGKNSLISQIVENRTAELVKAKGDAEDREREVRTLQERLKLSLDVTNIGIGEYIYVVNELRWDETMMRIYGYDPAVFKGGVQPWRDRVHPADVGRVESVTNEAVKRGAPFDVDFRIILPNNETRYLKVIGHTFLSPDGAPQRLISATIDVSLAKRREIEESLRLRLIVEHFPISVLVTDERGIIQLINHEFEDFFGYRAVEIMGQPLSHLITDAEEILSETELQQMVLASSRHRLGSNGSVRGKLKNGARIPVEIGLTSVPMGETRFIVASIFNITERVNSRNALERFELMAEGASVGIWEWVQHNGETKEFWSAKLYELLGYNTVEMSPGLIELEKLIHPDDYGRVMMEVDGQLAARQPFHLEYRLKTNSEGYRWFSASGKASFDVEGKPFRVVGSIQDIHHKKVLEQEIYATNQYLKLLMDSGNFMIIAKNLDGTVRFVNRAVEQKLGYAASELVGRTTFDLLHDVDELRARAGALSEELNRPIDPGFEAIIAKAALGGADENEWTFIRKDGTRFPVLESITGLQDQDGNIVGFLGMIVDLSENKKLQFELKKSNQELLRSNQELQQFAYVASHDLQAPLRHISTYAGILEEDLGGQINEGTKEALACIQKSIRRMRALIDDLLAFSRVGQGKLTFAAAKMDEVVKDVLDLLRDSIEATQAVVTVRSLPEIVCDAKRMEQVLQNLVQNALKYRRDGVSLHIEIWCSDKGKEWFFHVKDNGIGIKEEHQERIFFVFQRLHKPDKFPGNGIGLAICKKAVELHGGRFWVDSIEGVGSTFSFSIPKNLEV